jgi:hypothetical protein
MSGTLISVVVGGMIALCMVLFIAAFFVMPAAYVVFAVNQARGGELTLAERGAWSGLLTGHDARLGALSEVAP